MATLYFQCNKDEQDENLDWRIDFTKVANWFTDEACTIAAGRVGGSGDDVIFVDGTADDVTFPLNSTHTWHGLRHEASFGSVANTWTAHNITISGGELYWKPVEIGQGFGGNAAATTKASFFQPCWGIASTTENIFDGSDWGGASLGLLDDYMSYGGDNAKVLSGTTYWRNTNPGGNPTWNNGAITGDVICDEGNGLYNGASGTVSGNVIYLEGSSPAYTGVAAGFFGYGVTGKHIIHIATDGATFKAGTGESIFELYANQANITIDLSRGGTVTLRPMVKGLEISLVDGTKVETDGLPVTSAATRVGI